MVRRTSIVDPGSPNAIEENSYEESIMDENVPELDEDEEEEYGGELDANREAREARAQMESAMSAMNNEKAQLRKDMKKRKQINKEQEELCGPRLAQKIEKMLLDYNKSVGLADDNGNIVERTASEMKLLASDASSTLFQRE